MERCVGKAMVSMNRPRGVWATAKKTSLVCLDRLARGTLASPASTGSAPSAGEREMIQSRDAKPAAASMQAPRKGGNRH